MNPCATPLTCSRLAKPLSACLRSSAASSHSASSRPAASLEKRGRIGLRVLGRVRSRVYERIEPLAPTGLEGYRDGDLLSRSVADVDALQNLHLRAIGPPLVALGSHLPQSQSPGEIAIA